ncbi:hypothetical protein [Catenulispora pinisilvae]|uniref:hypothetical protein n=1 Tax=Catenulispora pinisilvae TaxID=2705253 RepID=UPI001892408A|nr:hypothetical protein [Catenulispora pinisilvae]
MSLSQVSLGRASRPRQPMTRKFARGAGCVFGFLAALAALGSVLLALADTRAHAELARFDAAPVCASSAPPSASAACKAEVAATLKSASLSGGKDPMWTLELRLSNGALVVTDIDDTNGEPDFGEAAVVTLWRGHCVTVRTLGEGDVSTYDDPGRRGNNDGGGFLALLVFTVLFESVSALYFTYFRVHPERMVAAYLLAAVSVAVTAALRLSHAYDAEVVASFVVPLAVAGLYLMWPRLEWAQRQTRWAGPVA